MSAEAPTVQFCRPDPLPLRFRLLANVVQVPLFFLATAAFGSLSLLASLFEKDGRVQHRIAQAWAAASMKIAMSPVDVIGAENLGKFPVAVYAANHASYMDTPAIFSSLPFQFRILARQTLWTIPFIGWHLNRSGQIPVDTINRRAAHSSLSAGLAALKSGMPLVVFPEGGRSLSGLPGKFMSGPAFMAIRAGVPLVPIAIIGSHELLPMHTRHFYPHKIKLVVGEPIPTAGYTTREADQATERLRQEISRLFYENACSSFGTHSPESRTLQP